MVIAGIDPLEVLVIGLLLGVSLLELWVWHEAIWWHSDEPKDPRNTP